MKQMIRNFPELPGLLFGLGDVVFRTIACLVFDPSEVRLYGSLLVGNVHHHNEIRAFGLGTMAWFGIAGALLLVLYAGVRIAESGMKPGNIGFLVSRGLLGAICGVLVLNVLESIATGKVTNYIGLAYGTRFTAINFGDLLLWVCLAALLPAIVFAFAEHFLGRSRA